MKIPPLARRLRGDINVQAEGSRNGAQQPQNHCTGQRPSGRWRRGHGARIQRERHLKSLGERRRRDLAGQGGNEDIYVTLRKPWVFFEARLVGPLLDQEPFRNIERFDDGLPTQLLSAACGSILRCLPGGHAQRSPCWRHCHIQHSSPEMHEHQVDSGWAHAAVDRGVWHLDPPPLPSKDVTGLEVSLWGILLPRRLSKARGPYSFAMGHFIHKKRGCAHENSCR